MKIVLLLLSLGFAVNGYSAPQTEAVRQMIEAKFPDVDAADREKTMEHLLELEKDSLRLRRGEQVKYGEIAAHMLDRMGPQKFNEAYEEQIKEGRNPLEAISNMED